MGSHLFNSSMNHQLITVSVCCSQGLSDAGGEQPRNPFGRGDPRGSGRSGFRSLLDIAGLSCQCSQWDPQPPSYKRVITGDRLRLGVAQTRYEFLFFSWQILSWEGTHMTTISVLKGCSHALVKLDTLHRQGSLPIIDGIWRNISNRLPWLKGYLIIIRAIC